LERTEQPNRHRFEILYDCSEMELVACTRKPPQPHSLEAMVRLEVGEAHLDPLALIA